MCLNESTMDKSQIILVPCQLVIAPFLACPLSLNKLFHDISRPRISAFFDFKCIFEFLAKSLINELAVGFRSYHIQYTYHAHVCSDLRNFIFIYKVVAHGFVYICNFLISKLRHYLNFRHNFKV